MCSDTLYLGRSTCRGTRVLLNPATFHPVTQIRSESIYRLSIGRNPHYIYMVSLSFLGRHEECNRYFWQTASRRVERPTLKMRMVDLSECRVEDFEHYRIWDEIIS